MLDTTKTYFFGVATDLPDNGTPEVVEIRTAAGELIETSIANIRY